MNDDAQASSSAAGAYYHDGAQQEAEAAPTAGELAKRRKRNRQMFNRKRCDLLDSLIRDIDLVVFAELGMIYYMDCSFLRFLLRALAQFIYLTPKHPPLPDNVPNTRIMGALLGSNLICILLHTLLSPPAGTEATRGYVHGGLAMDFIGQAAPTSRIRLVLLDLLVVVLQMTQMSTFMARWRLKEQPKASPQVTAETPAPAVQQDLDAEERGVIRADEQQDIEMQTLNLATSRTDPAPADSTEDDHTALLAPLTPRTDAHIFDAFHSGQIVIADLDLRKHVLEQVRLAKTPVTEADGQSGVPGLRAELASRVLRMRMGADALRESM